METVPQIQVAYQRVSRSTPRIPRQATLWMIKSKGIIFKNSAFFNHQFLARGMREKAKQAVPSDVLQVHSWNRNEKQDVPIQ